MRRVARVLAFLLGLVVVVLILVGEAVVLTWHRVRDRVLSGPQ